MEFQVNLGKFMSTSVLRAFSTRLSKRTTLGTTSYFDPCLRMPCKQYEICVSSKNGLQYNCISEPRPVKKTVTTINFKPNVQLIKQTPAVKTTTNVIQVNPCLSSPCGFKQICKTVPERPFQYVCEDEVELNAIKQTIFEPEQREQVTSTLNTILRKIETGQFYNKVKGKLQPAVV